MPTDLEELEALNTAAIETMSRLETSDMRRQGSFWDSDSAKSFRPSQQNVSVPLFESSRKYDEVAPKKYYRSSFGSSESYGYNQMSDNFYRRMLVSVYKNQPPKEEIKNERKVARIVSPESMSNMSLSFNLTKPKPQYFYVETDNIVNTAKQDMQDTNTSGAVIYDSKIPAVSESTKHQLTAIVMSGVLRILTTMVLNWARDRHVPYELL